MNAEIAYVEQAPMADVAQDGDMDIEQALPDGFVYLDEAVMGVLWDAKYASEDNFTGTPVDGYGANRIALSGKMVSALVRARDLATEEGCFLLVWDAARPQRAVDRFLAWSEEDEDGKTREAHYPKLTRAQLFEQGYVARKSGHSRGAAIDLTLVAIESGLELDMGGAFDLMDAKSSHGAKGLTSQQTANRALLKRIMEKCGFSAYSREWWHYSLNDEPFPEQYFDFAITSASGPTEMPELIPANPLGR